MGVTRNREKDRVTIEQTFEALLKLVQELDDEQSRSLREGLDEESLAILDLLKTPDLKAPDIKRLKAVDVDLLKELKAEKLRVDQWRDKETTRDAVLATFEISCGVRRQGFPFICIQMMT